MNPFQSEINRKVLKKFVKKSKWIGGTGFPTNLQNRANLKTKVKKKMLWKGKMVDFFFFNFKYFLINLKKKKSNMTIPLKGWQRTFGNMLRRDTG